MDWVYRDHIRDEAGAIVQFTGSYAREVSTLDPGPSNALAKVLYDSHNRLAYVSDFGGVGLPINRAGRAEGRNARMARVQGMVTWTVGTWALGSTYNICMRIVAMDQDPVDGFAAPVGGYSAFNNLGVIATPATFANDHNLLWERRFARNFSTANDSERQNMFINVPVKRTLNAIQGLFFYMETEAGSVRLSPQCWLRTLVSDEA